MRYPSLDAVNSGRERYCFQPLGYAATTVLMGIVRGGGARIFHSSVYRGEGWSKKGGGRSEKYFISVAEAFACFEKP